MLQWLGHRSYRGSKLVPLKLTELNLLGTDVGTKQDWLQYGNVFDPTTAGFSLNPLRMILSRTGDSRVKGAIADPKGVAEMVGRKSIGLVDKAGTRSISTATTKVEGDKTPSHKLARQIRKARKNPSQDTNKDGKVDEQDN